MVCMPGSLIRDKIKFRRAFTSASVKEIKEMSYGSHIFFTTSLFAYFDYDIHNKKLNKLLSRSAIKLLVLYRST